MTVRLALVDDHQPFRERLRALLQRDPQIEIVAEAGSGQEMLDIARTAVFDVVLMDIKLPGIDGIEATRRVADRTTVFLCSTYAPDALPAGAADCGAAAYVHKEELSAELLTRLWADASLGS